HVLHPYFVLTRQLLPQVEPAVRIKIQPSDGAAHSLQRHGRRSQRILVGGELDDSGEPEFPADFLDAAARFIRPERFDIGWNQWHYSKYHFQIEGILSYSHFH